MRSFRGDCAACRPMVKVALALGVEALETKHWMDRWKAEKDFEPRSKTASTLAEKTRRDVGDSPARAGEGWSSEEDQQLTREFWKGKKFEQMAKAHQRSRGAIMSRLVHLGLISR